jgi:glutamyl-tRNA synthetase
VRAVPDLGELEHHFDAGSVSKSAAKFDPAELDVLNRHLVQALPHAAVAARLAGMGIAGDKAEPFWNAVRENIDRLPEAAQWWKIVQDGPVAEEQPPEDRAFFARAAELLPAEPWDGSTWQAWTSALRKETGRGGKALFLPLRLALTGRPSGPELAALLPLIGRQGVLARLKSLQ